MMKKTSKKRKKLNDTCHEPECDLLVWQYAEDGTPYCAAHARWSHLEVERMVHPLEAHPHARRPPKALVDKAVRILDKYISRLGPAEAFWVAECLEFEWGIQWWDDKVVIRLTDLQLIAFSAALKAHGEPISPPKKAGKRGKKKKRD